MKDIYIIHYSVKGIKALDEWVHLSFYKKTITKAFDIRKYNTKGIYGTNGAGKSGIITSARILRSLIIDDSYLSNPLVQKQLEEIINKLTGQLEYDVDFVVNYEDGLKLYKYQVKIGKRESNRWSVMEESLSAKRAVSHSKNMTILFHVLDAELKDLAKDDNRSSSLIEQTKNLLSASSLTALAFSRVKQLKDKNYMQLLFDNGIVPLFLFGNSLFVYMDSEDEHTDYFINEMFYREKDVEELEELFSMMEHKWHLERQKPLLMSATSMVVPVNRYTSFYKQVEELETFIKIFRKDLRRIRIDKKQEKKLYICELIMDYEDYQIHAEFESTGIKKLIRLFSYLQKMVEGNVVFIDELDSNLHDVYLCALLEYLMEFGAGQLCFTTHNIGPMDVLRKNKESIDFLSEDKKIHSWTASGNYSPSKLYRNGMIEGSPFNIDSFDFIGVFDSSAGE